ncbi:hypothetical protein BHE74_00005337 [Ensete ventricosum]|nr:hypothetical protein BHE74_00005337 [Ensete ventricosum]
MADFRVADGDEINDHRNLLEVLRLSPLEASQKLLLSRTSEREICRWGAEDAAVATGDGKGYDGGNDPFAAAHATAELKMGATGDEEKGVVSKLSQTEGRQKFPDEVKIKSMVLKAIAQVEEEPEVRRVEAMEQK